MKICIVGCGYVGTGMKKIFPDAIDIDPPKGVGSYADAQDAELALVCVPTPRRPDGACETTIVRDVVRELDRVGVKYILVKSTVTPGTCDNLESECMRSHVVFSPEYMGESKYWTPARYPDPKNPLSHGFIILGGTDFACERVADIFMPRVGPATRIRFMTALEAEIVKYCENSYFALKITFANLMRAICDAHGASYYRVREGWLDDPRVAPMHSTAFRLLPGFSGKCLPKDISALAAHCHDIGVDASLLDAVIEANNKSLGQ